MPIFKYFYILFLFLPVLKLSGQDSLSFIISSPPVILNDSIENLPADSLALKTITDIRLYYADSTGTSGTDSLFAESLDTTSTPLIRRVELYVDYLKLIGMAFPSEKKAEVGLAVITGLNIGINAEFGYGQKSPEDYIYNGNYEVTGYYGRIGLAYYYKFLPEVNFYAGAKYAISQYQDDATATISSGLWDDYSQKFQRENLKANWAELVLGSESRWKGNFYFGFVFRLRFMIEQDNFSPVEVYMIPGYGRTYKNVVPALNLYFKYILDFE